MSRLADSPVTPERRGADRTALADRSRVAILVAAMVVLAPAVAFACPVCGLGNAGDNNWAYGAMSIVLSVLPLGMLVGGSFWLYRRVKQREEGPEEELATEPRPADRRQP